MPTLAVKVASEVEAEAELASKASALVSRDALSTLNSSAAEPTIREDVGSVSCAALGTYVAILSPQLDFAKLDFSH